MIVGFSKHGKGLAQGAINYLLSERSAGYAAFNYLLGEKNRSGVPRTPLPVVVRGNPTVTQSLIDSVPFQWRYTSGVLSFSAGERITPEMEKKIMDEFEATAFAGLSVDRYNILWIRHAHTGREEIHFVVPRVELSTGKSLNIAPPGKASRTLFDTFRSKINAEHGLSDPDDPARRRTLSLPSVIAKLQNVPGKSWSKSNSRVREAINGFVEAKAQAGKFNSRKDVVQELQSAGFQVVRQGKDYLTVLQPITGERFRLRGASYAEKWPEPQSGVPSPGTQANPKRAAAFEKQLVSLRQDRAAFNQERYRVAPTSIQHPSIVYDRIGNSSPCRVQTAGSPVARTRTTIDPLHCRLNQAVDRWSGAHGNLEFASDRFGRAHRTFANDFDQKIATCENRQASNDIMDKYDVPQRSTTAGRELDQEREPDEELEPEMDTDS